MVDMILSGEWGGTDEGGTVGMIPTNRADWPCILNTSKLSTDDSDGATVFECE